MVCLTPSEFRSRLRFLEPVVPNPVVLVSERRTGPTIKLEDYRQDMADRRIESIGKPGIYLDQSETGAGKSHADMAAFRMAGRSLSVQPTHENCAEVVAACRLQGLDAVAYPARKTRGKDQNCWNDDANAAERMGLSPTSAICPYCSKYASCSESGYLAQIKQADAASIAVATHARAKHAGLAQLAEGRDFVSIHEDAVDVLVPQLDLPAERLEVARSIVERLLVDPYWLNWFGDNFGVDLEGNIVTDVEKEERRTKLFEFFTHLANVIDHVIEIASATDSVQSIEPPHTLPVPPGAHNLLFRISRDLKADFGTKPIWPLLLFTATGAFHHEGVVTHEQRRQIGRGDALAIGRENDLHDAAKSSTSEGDVVVV